MCVVVLALEAHPKWRIILAGNRDEFHARRSAPLSRWADADHLIAGRDLQSGGSWLGVSEEGRLAVVTNVRQIEGPDPSKASRGALVADFLRENALPPVDRLDGFNAFNLIVINAAGGQFLSNRPGPEALSLNPGFHALSNGTRDVPWPRKDALLHQVQARLDSALDAPHALLDILRDETGTGEEPGIFIRGEVYGTRCSTVIAVDHDGTGIALERRFRNDGEAAGDTSLAFDWGKR